VITLVVTTPTSSVKSQAGPKKRRHHRSLELVEAPSQVFIFAGKWGFIVISKKLPEQDVAISRKLVDGAPVNSISTVLL